MKYHLTYNNFDNTNIAWNKMWILHPHNHNGKFVLKQNILEKYMSEVLKEDLWVQIGNSIHIPMGFNLLRQVESRL